jgi:hypothetical protein
MLGWLNGNWQWFLATWGAVLSTVLAGREWWRSRHHVRFAVSPRAMGVGPGSVILASPDVVVGGTPVVAIDIYNRGRDPLPLQQVGLRLKTGWVKTGWLMFNQMPDLPGLKYKVDPADGFTMASETESLREALAGKGCTLDSVRGPFCTDGAGRMYRRSLRRRERQALKVSLGETSPTATT